MSDKINFLKRIFGKLNKDQIINIIETKNPEWTTSKKKSKLKREELETDFMALSSYLIEEELEAFQEVALTKRTMGYPVYTYRIGESQSYLDNVVKETNNYTFLNSNQITVENIEVNENIYRFKMQIKQHNETRMQEILNPDNLIARYPVEIILNKKNNILSMIAGTDNVRDIAEKFIKQVIKWDLVNLEISEDFTQSYEIGSTHFKTALIIDFVYNRLKKLNINAKFKELKFLTGRESARSKGIRNVTINGNDILSSQLACEYVTVGSAVVSFKLDLIYQSRSFSAAFYFKGDNSNQLKFVLVDLPENIQEGIMSLMQNEYITMCDSGISDMDETKTRLSTIKDKYLAPDKYVFGSIQKVIIENNSLLLEILDNTKNEEIREIIAKTAYNNRVLLDNVGYDEEEDNLRNISVQLEIDFDNLEDIEDDVKVSI